MTQHTPEAICQAIDSMIGPMLKDPARPAFWAWPKEDHLIVAFNPLNLRSTRGPLEEKFTHDLATVLGGVKIVPTNTRGVFLQIGLKPTPPMRLSAKYPLDLTQQPGPFFVPVGMTLRGPKWLHVLEALGVLVGGSPGYGKTILLHAWIRALLHGQGCQLWLYDGKRGNHFRRYAEEKQVRFVGDLDEALGEISAELTRRQDLFTTYAVHDIETYNELGFVEPLQPIVLIADEIALISPECAAQLTELSKIGREQGFALVGATQRTGADDVDVSLKQTLSTRICFAVPEYQDSLVVLGRTSGENGADRLPKIPGRMKIKSGASIEEAQGFFVDLKADRPAGDLPVGSDWQLALRAAAETQGRLSIPTLEKWGMGNYRARVLLERWQDAGWLEGGGQGTLRCLTPRVLAAISQSRKVTAKSQSPSQSSQSSPNDEERNIDAERH